MIQMHNCSLQLSVVSVQSDTSTEHAAIRLFVELIGSDLCSAAQIKYSTGPPCPRPVSCAAARLSSSSWHASKVDLPSVVTCVVCVLAQRSSRFDCGIVGQCRGGSSF